MAFSAPTDERRLPLPRIRKEVKVLEKAGSSPDATRADENLVFQRRAYLEQNLPGLGIGIGNDR